MDGRPRRLHMHALRTVPAVRIPRHQEVDLIRSSHAADRRDSSPNDDVVCVTCSVGVCEQRTDPTNRTYDPPGKYEVEYEREKKRQAETQYWKRFSGMQWFLVTEAASRVQRAAERFGVKLPSTQLQMGALFAFLFVLLVVNLSGKHSLIVFSSVFNLGVALALLAAIDGGLYTPGGRKKLLTEAELPTFSITGVELNLVATGARLLPIIFSSRFRTSGAVFLGVADFLAVVILASIVARRKEFPINEPSMYYYGLAAAALLFSFPFRAPLAQNFLLDSLWSWSACLEPLTVVPACVTAVLAANNAAFKEDAPFPVLASLSRLVSGICAVIYWLFVTEARRNDYRAISGLILLLQGAGVCGAVLVASLALKAEIARRKLGHKPLLTVLSSAKAESAKAL